MPDPPAELLSLPPKPKVPAPTANDLQFSQFVDAQSITIDGCYATHQDLVDWVAQTKATIEAANAATLAAVKDSTKK